MIIELNLAQSEEILAVLSTIKKPSDNLKASMSTIKKRVKLETEVQVEEIERLIKRVEDNGYKDANMLESFKKAKESIKLESVKTKDKYFDGDGKEKPTIFGSIPVESL